MEKEWEIQTEDGDGLLNLLWVFKKKNPDTPRFQGKKIGSVSSEAAGPQIINLIKELQNHAFFFGFVLGSHIIRPFFWGFVFLGNPVLCPTIFWGGPNWS